MTLELAEGDVVAELSDAAAAEDGAAMPGRARQRRLWSCTEKCVFQMIWASGEVVAFFGA